MQQNNDAPFRQQIFHVSEAEAKLEVEPYRLLDDLRQKPVATVNDFRHFTWLPGGLEGRKPQTL